MKPTVPEVLPLANALYATGGGAAGCCLHVVLDDGNVKDSHVQFCLDEARRAGHSHRERLASLLLEMSPTQRKKVGDRVVPFGMKERWG